MPPFQTITYEKNNNIACVTLNRPRFLNVYNMQMRDELYQALSAIKDDDEVKVAIVRGAGDKAFCAGADLTEFLTTPSPIVSRQIRRERDIWKLLLSLPQPIIAALHGYVLGSGLEIALCCDLRIASEDTKFGLPEVPLGMIPGAGGTQTLARAAGLATAMEMLLTNRWLDAHRAYETGLVNRVVSKVQLLLTAEEMAMKVASCSQGAVAIAKQAIIRGLDLPLGEGLALESRLAHRLLTSSVDKS